MKFSLPIELLKDPNPPKLTDVVMGSILAENSEEMEELQQILLS